MLISIWKLFIFIFYFFLAICIAVYANVHKQVVMTPAHSLPETHGTCMLAPKMIPEQTAMLSGDGQPLTGIVTQKEWVVPPRPKVRNGSDK